MTPYQQSVDDVAASFGGDLRAGLSEADVRSRLEEFGRNELAAEPPTPAWRRFLAQFEDTLVIVLLVATAISGAMWVYEHATPVPYEAIAILAIVLLNATMGYLQESRAQAAVEALRDMTADTAVVVRAASQRRIAAAEVVPGDLIILEEGDRIPADARLVEAIALQTSEAALTGESEPVLKSVEAIVGDVAVGDRRNMIFSGTTVTRGRARAIVTDTGMATQMGRIAGLLEATPEDVTPLQRELDRLGKRLGAIVVVIAAVMIGAIFAVGDIDNLQDVFAVFIFGVALAVAAVPEGLPAIVTAVLSIGVQRMARRNAIIRHLAAVETLGSASVIASDKTGTLTRNEMTVRTVVTASGCVTFAGTGYVPEGDVACEGGGAIEGALRQELERTLAAADRASNAVLERTEGKWVVQGDPTEGALVVAARKAGLEAEALEARLERIGEVPFSSQRKLMSTVHTDTEQPERILVFTKGAPDILLDRCTHELVGDEARPLDEVRRKEIGEANEDLARKALRTLGVAARALRRDTYAPEDASELVEEELVFLGLVGMMDPPREEASSSVARARQAGVRPIMITGDHPVTAAVIARELGVSPTAQVITGAELASMDDAELERAVERVSVFARVDPEHKLRIVDALQRRGEVVAMTGDGVNDAPALKSADIGVAMGITGTDVSKQAADMIVADDNFASIVAAVEEGRAIFSNIRKFLRYLLSSNIGEVLTMFLGVLLADLLGLRVAGIELVVPLLATQILWINMVTDGAPALALGVEPADPDLMRQPPRPRDEPVITSSMWRSIFLIGAVMAAGTLLVLDAGLPGGLIEGAQDLAHAQTMAFTTLMLFQVFNVFNARSDERSALVGLFSNAWLTAAIVLSVALQVAVVHVPFLQRAFGTTDLSAGDWLVATAVASSVLWLAEIAKLMMRARRRGGNVATTE